MKQTHVRTPLAKVRGWGSAHDGTSHFLWQRVTAIAMVPLTLWFVGSLNTLAVGADQAKVTQWLGSGFNAAGLILLLSALFYHAKLGLQVIIEDYVHAPGFKYIALLLNSFIMIVFALISILAVLKLHLYVPAFGGDR